MKHVYQLRATGEDGLGCTLTRSITTTTVFPTEEAAGRRIEPFRRKCLDQHLLCEPVEVAVVPLEVIDN
jgi:hypothetical protein